MSQHKKFAIIIILVTNAIMISFLESFIPIPVPIPGVKLGLGNIITMIGIAFLGLNDVLFVVLVRCLVVAVLTRGIMMLAFSLSGGILSALTMWLLYKKLSGFFSIKGISIVGAIVHNAVQLAVATLILGESVMMYYLPVLLVSAVVTGLITGSIGEITINEIRKGVLSLNENEPGIAAAKAEAFSNAPLKTPIETEPGNIDGLIKLIMAIGLTVIPFLCETPLSFLLIFFYLAMATLISKIKPRTLLISAASYGIVVLIPYSFGLLMNVLLHQLFPNAILAYQQGLYESFLRLLRFFLLWYISILYFQTTPVKTVVGILEKIMRPLQAMGVPVKDYLKIVMLAVAELTEMGTEMKASLARHMRSVQRETGRFSINIKGIAQMIIALISSSFGRLDKIENDIEQVNPEELYHYHFSLSLQDAGAGLSFILLLAVLSIIERGVWF